MNTWLTFTIIVIALFAVGALLWRLFSNRHELPCPVWLSWMVEADNPFTKANQAKTILSQAGVAPGMSVLDAGCGPGRLTIPTARLVGTEGKVVGVDLQSGMLDKVRAKLEAEGLSNVTLLQAGLGDGELPENTFDRAYLVTVLGEIPNQSAALAEIFSALKPGGILAVSEVIFDPHFQSREKVLALGREAGFEAQDFFGKKLAYIQQLKKPETK